MNSLFLDVTGIGVLFGGEEALAREVLADLARLGYEAQVAIANTIGAAWAAASDTSKFQVPGFKFHVADPTRNPELGTWNLSSLRLPQQTIDLLSRLGIVRLEQLLALPRASLPARFGELVLLQLDQLFGRAEEKIVPHRPPPQFVAQRVLEYPLDSREAVQRLVRELVEQLAQDLAARRYGIVRLSCRLDCAPGRPVLLQVGLFRPSAQPQHVWDVLRMQLEQAALPGPVGRITLAAPLTAPLENRQRELFAGNREEASRQLALFIDRLSSRLGPKAVLRPELAAEVLPERIVRYVPWIGSGSKVRDSGFRRDRGRGRGSRFKVRSSRLVAEGRTKLGTQYSVRGTKPPPFDSRPSTPDPRLSTRLPSALLRPLVLHTEPLALEVISVAPDGPPVSFRWNGKTCRIVRSWGPERIETGWWRGRSVRRDYYRVETQSGQRYWLFRRLDTGQWHLHGEFA